MEAGSVRIARGFMVWIHKALVLARHSQAHQPGIFSDEYLGDYGVSPYPDVDSSDGHRYQRGQNPGPVKR
jgi:hypothetical protein